MDGSQKGWTEGVFDGCEVGCFDGIEAGWQVGACMGCAVGIPIG
jgi:hypothetical protein